MNGIEFQTFRDSLLDPCDAGDLKQFKIAHEKLMQIKSTQNHQYELVLIFSFQRSIESGHLNILEYLIKEHSDEIHKDILDIDDLFFATCMYDKPELARYILEQNKLKDLGLNMDTAFESAYKYELLDIIKSLIFDFNLKKSEIVTNCLKEELSITADIKDMLKISELNNNLNENLETNLDTQINKKLKI